MGAVARLGAGLRPSAEREVCITYKKSRPYHPQTCGKVERFHQTLERYLGRQPPAASLAELQLQLDTFRAYYNHHRPHRAISGRTPLMAINSRLKARPEAPPAAPHLRVRHDTVDKAGRVTLRYLSRLRHIGIGRYYIGARITLLVAGHHIRVVDEDGRLPRELTIDPTRDYQPLGTPTGRRKIGHYVPRQVGTITLGFRGSLQQAERAAPRVSSMRAFVEAAR